MDNVSFLIFSEIAVDFWLEDHFTAQRDPEVEDFVQTSTPVIDLVHVTSEHPTYDFQVGDLVALVSANQDPFWLAQVKKIKEDSLSVTYYIMVLRYPERGWFGKPITQNALVASSMFILDSRQRNNFLPKAKPFRNKP
jgi:hypothetical protein